MLMKAKDSLLLIIDIQERLAPTMSNAREVINGSAKLVSVAKELGVPFIFSEQYPKGLGPTMIDVRLAAGDNATYLPKIEFSCAKNEGIIAEISKQNKKQIIIAGIELHICVLQTAIDLKSRGYDVFVVSNACSSQDDIQHNIACQRMQSQGVEIVSLEMVIYEWLEKAGTDIFKSISKKYL